MSEKESFFDGRISLYAGDCLDVLRGIESDSIDAIVTDPPYGLEFMGKGWDGADGFRRSLNRADADRDNVFGRQSRRGPEYRAGTLFQDFIYVIAIECLRVLKPGGHIVSFGGTRTYHRMASALEDAGFEIRDQLAWVYGSGFPKSYDVAQSIEKLITTGKARRPDRDLGGLPRNRFSGDIEGGLIANTGGKLPLTTPEAAAWEGCGTALKPAWEPICLARKPLIGTVAANVLEYRTGALNIDGCRVGDFVNTTPAGTDRYNKANYENGYRPSPYGRDGEASAHRRYTDKGSTNFAATPGPRGGAPLGRWPANLIHDGSEEVVAAFPQAPGQMAKARTDGVAQGNNTYGALKHITRLPEPRGDTGSAARFFYTAKADSDDRIGSKHPTVKPVDLMQWLVRLVTPKGGIVLDPFAGTGTTGEAAWREGMNAVLIERETEYQEDIRRRMRLCLAGKEERRRVSVKASGKERGLEDLPLFN